MSKLNSERDPYEGLAQHLRDVIREEVAKATMPKPYLTVAEAAQTLTVSESTIRAAITDGELATTHFRGRTIIERTEIERYVEERRKKKRR